MSQGPWDIALGSAWEPAGTRTRMTNRIFHINRDHVGDIIGVVYLGKQALGKGV